MVSQPSPEYFTEYACATTTERWIPTLRIKLVQLQRWIKGKSHKLWNWIPKSNDPNQKDGLSGKSLKIRNKTMTNDK